MAAWASSVKPRDGLTAWVDIWRLPFFVIGMAVGALAVRLERYSALTALFAAGWTDPNGYRTRFVRRARRSRERSRREPRAEGAERQLAFRRVAVAHQPTPRRSGSRTATPSGFARTASRGSRSSSSVSCWSIASGVLAESGRVAWWSLDSAAAAAFAQRLQRDMPLRAKIADVVGLDLQAFDEKAPEVLENSHGIGTFPDVARVVNALRTGNPW